MTAHAQESMLPPAGSLLFVYGTLQRGGQYHPILQRVGAAFSGMGKTITPYPLLLAAYPCLLDRPGRGHAVEGEVYRLARPRDWIPVDRLEGHLHAYRRRLEKIQLEDAIVEAWTYFYIRKNVSEEVLPAVPRFPVRRRGPAPS